MFHALPDAYIHALVVLVPPCFFTLFLSITIILKRSGIIFQFPAHYIKWGSISPSGLHPLDEVEKEKNDLKYDLHIRGEVVENFIYRLFSGIHNSLACRVMLSS